MTDWAVITSATNHELIACGEFASLGVEAYCPVIKTMTKPRRKSKPVEVIRAAFPQYLFIQNGFSDFSATPVLRQARVHQLRMGESFCTVSDVEIEFMRGGDAVRSDIESDMQFRVGDHVRVTSGPFADMEGEVTNELGPRMEVVLFKTGVEIKAPVFLLSKVEGVSLQ